MKIIIFFGRTVIVCVTFIWLYSFAVSAEETTTTADCLNSASAGVANLVGSYAGDTEKSRQAIDELASYAPEPEAEEEESESTLFMANVNNSVNVRTEPSEEAEKAGLLYKDCGGRILERGEDWSRIQSGELVGWVSNDYVLFDEEAEELASDVGFKILTVETDALRIREEPSTDAMILGLVASGDELEVVNDEETEWIEVAYEEEEGYVSAEYVKVTFSIDAGETMEQIRIREEAEAEAKRKALLRAQQAKVDADGNETKLLAALVQCEAGTGNYEGQLAVAACVMNRVRSSAYPNSIYGVIYASGQFTPALNGKVAAVYNNKVYDSCFTAAQDALNGKTNIGTATHFKRAGSHEGVVVGGNVFW